MAVSNDSRCIISFPCGSGFTGGPPAHGTKPASSKSISETVIYNPIVKPHHVEEFRERRLTDVGKMSLKKN